MGDSVLLPAVRPQNRFQVKQQQQRLKTALQTGIKVDNDANQSFLFAKEQIKSGVTPIAPNEQMLNAARGDAVMQYNIAFDHLKSVMPAAYASNVIRDMTPATIDELNRHWPGFAKFLGNKAQIDDRYFTQYWNNYRRIALAGNSQDTFEPFVDPVMAGPKNMRHNTTKPPVTPDVIPMWKQAPIRIPKREVVYPTNQPALPAIGPPGTSRVPKSDVIILGPPTNPETQPPDMPARTWKLYNPDYWRLQNLYPQKWQSSDTSSSAYWDQAMTYKEHRAAGHVYNHKTGQWDAGSSTPSPAPVGAPSVQTVAKMVASANNAIKTMLAGLARDETDEIEAMSQKQMEAVQQEIEKTKEIPATLDDLRDAVASLDKKLDSRSGTSAWKAKLTVALTAAKLLGLDPMRVAQQVLAAPVEQLRDSIAGLINDLGNLAHPGHIYLDHGWNVGGGKLKGRPRRMVGFGIEPDIQPKYRQFGRYLLHIPSLERNTLNIKFPSLASHPKIPQRVISQTLTDLLQDLVSSGTMNPTLYAELSDEDRKIFADVVHTCQIGGRLGISKTEDNTDLKRFAIVRGEILAGNDAPQLIKELKHLTLKLLSEGKIPKKSAHDLLIEIAVLT